MKLYNTLTRSIDQFKPQSGNHVKMYSCGLTVYSQPQIGNWVAYIYSDVLTRALLQSGFEVERVQNITDVGHLVSDDDNGEDKMQKGARKEGKTAWEIADKYIAIADDEAYTQLGLLRPNKLVRATDLIPEQIAFVQELEAKGFTYIIPNEGVYFDTSKLSDYGKLAQLDIEGLRAGARVIVDGKRNITDFALWKFSPKDEQRDMEWESPFGEGNGMGFPGWHLECSAIARQNLGDQLDLHTGGIDHIPVHHTNEIAQTEAVTGKQFVRHWFHNNFIKVNNTKLSKSLGNSYTLQDIQDKGFSLDALKTLVLSSHYRTEGNFSWEILEAAQNRLNKWRAAMDLLWQEDVAADKDFNSQVYADKITAALQDDLNTPQALTVIDEAVSTLEQLHVNAVAIQAFADSVKEQLGIDLLAGKSDITDDQKTILLQRSVAREAKNWAESDSLRDQLLSEGITVRDVGSGQVWNRTY